MKEEGWKLFINKCPFCDFVLDYEEYYKYTEHELTCNRCLKQFKHRDKRQKCCNECIEKHYRYLRERHKK